MSVTVSGCGNYLDFIGVYLNFPLFFYSVDVVDGSLCCKSPIIWVECVGDNLGDVVGVCNIGCVRCWRGRVDVACVKIE